jgi:hypothetical protein
LASPDENPQYKLFCPGLVSPLAKNIKTAGAIQICTQSRKHSFIALEAFTFLKAKFLNSRYGAAEIEIPPDKVC